MGFDPTYRILRSIVPNPDKEDEDIVTDFKVPLCGGSAHMPDYCSLSPCVRSFEGPRRPRCQANNVCFRRWRRIFPLKPTSDDRFHCLVKGLKMLPFWSSGCHANVGIKPPLSIPIQFPNKCGQCQDTSSASWQVRNRISSQWNQGKGCVFNVG